jgi:nucleoside-diphosphate-sugar epimerase
MKKLLIIGGNGYIGNRLIEDYRIHYDITNVDLCWFNEAPDKCHTIDYNELQESTIKKFDTVILLAAHSSVKMCEGDPQYSFNNNVRNFINLLPKLSKKQKFIYASSSSVYGNVADKCVKENYTNFVQHNHYDTTKYIIDLYANLYDIEYYALRFGTVNGGSSHVRNDIMLNAMTHSALNKGEIQLYIKDIIRPILGISDLSRAIQKIIETPEDRRGVYNLASFNSTAEKLAYAVSKITGAKVIEYEADPNSTGVAQPKFYNFSINSDKFSETFNYKFQETPESIVAELIERNTKSTFTNRNNPIHYV